MNLAIIAAVSENNVIGSKDKIPWKIKEDMQRFKGLTINHPIIMGRKTYDSLPHRFKPLPQRKNIVLSNSLNQCEGIYIARTIDEALALAGEDDTYVIGGSDIYKAFLPRANKMELTRVHQHFDGDTYFPEMEWGEWNIDAEIKNTSESGIPYSFLTYSRK